MPLRFADEKVTQAKAVTRCGAGRVIQSLDDEDLAYFDGMIREGKTATHIAAVLREDGHDISHFTMQRHMRGQCSCR